MKYFFRVSSDVFQGFSKSRGGLLGRAKRSDISRSFMNYNPMVIKRGNGKTYVYNIFIYICVPIKYGSTYYNQT
jgi:hypothetical protein